MRSPRRPHKRSVADPSVAAHPPVAGSPPIIGCHPASIAVAVGCRSLSGVDCPRYWIKAVAHRRASSTATAARWLAARSSRPAPISSAHQVNQVQRMYWRRGG
uniref:Uncharacterized protein n=1 Tax=Oryza rufipogon TaxID=4529 RepID=A0A0E0QFZ4_ORYRU